MSEWKVGLDGRRYRTNREHAVVRDRGTGIVMIRLRPRKAGELNVRTEEVAPGWIVDFDAEDKPFEIEVLNTSAFPPAVLALLPPEFIFEDGGEEELPR